MARDGSDLRWRSRPASVARVAAAALALLTWSASDAAPDNDRRGGRERQLLVTAAQADTDLQRLTIEGLSFGHRQVRVWLGERELEVFSTSERRIVALLPSDMAPGSYRLTVSRGRGSERTDVFDVTLGATGPEGPAGDPGPPGEPGPPGPPGGDSGELASLAQRVSLLEQFLGLGCPVGQQACGGGCADVLSDPANCGSCGNVCTTGVCQAGACSQPPPDADVFLVPFQGTPSPTSAVIGTQAELRKVDVYTLVDRSGANSDEISVIRAVLGPVLADLACSPGAPIGTCIPDLWSGIGGIGFGDVGGGEPYVNYLDLQPDPLQAGPALPAGALGAGQEAILLALHSASTGEGSAACAVATPYPERGSCSDSPAGSGGVGYPCFRPDAKPLVVLVSDNSPRDELACPAFADVTASLHDAGVNVLGVATAPGARPGLDELALETGARDATGLPLTASGEGTAVVDGVIGVLGRWLGSAAVEHVTVRLVDDPSDSVNAVDAFVARVETAALGSPACPSGLDTLDADGDGVPETYSALVSGTSACWRIVTRSNTTVAPAAGPQEFLATLEIEGSAGFSETRSIRFVVPGL